MRISKALLPSTSGAILEKSRKQLLEKRKIDVVGNHFRIFARFRKFEIFSSEYFELKETGFSFIGMSIFICVFPPTPMGASEQKTTHY